MLARLSARGRSGRVGKAGVPDEQKYITFCRIIIKRIKTKTLDNLTQFSIFKTMLVSV